MYATNYVHIDLENVLSVYSGKNGKCCCGCSGKHTYLEANRKAASISRGYTVRDEEINDRSVKLILNKVLAAEEKEVDDTFVSTVIGNRLYVVYVKEAV